MLPAKRLQKQRVSKAYTLDHWSVEAGPMYFDETVAGMKKATGEATDLIKAREPQPYASEKR
jgi:hypothetical protein